MCSLYGDIKRTRSEHLVDLLCSLDGVLRVKHNTLVVTREGGTQKKAKLTIIEGGWIWLDTTQYTPF